MPATDLERLVVQLSADIRRYEKALARANGLTNKQFNAIESRARKLDSRLGKIGQSAANNLIAPLAGIGAALTVREISHYADAWTSAGNRIRAAGQIAGREGRSLEEINDIANRTRSSISATTDLYSKLLRSTAAVAKSELEVAKATEIVNKAFKAGGAATSEQLAAILQLSQGLGSGLLQGDELRSVRENAPLLGAAIAKEFNTTIAGLKQLGKEGELTTDRIFKAILNSENDINAAFSVTNQTINDGITRVQNALTQYIGQTDEGLSATQRLVAGLNAFADDFDNIADITLKVASIIAGALVGRALTGMIAKLGLGVVALSRFAVALRGVQSASSLAAAFGRLSAAAGPVGLIIGGAVVTALAVFSDSSAEASIAARTYAGALEEVEKRATSTAKAVEVAANGINEKTRNALTGGVKEGEAEVRRSITAISEQFDFLFRSVPIEQFGEENFNALKKISSGLEAGSISAEEAENALFAMANSNPDFQRLAEQLSPLLNALAKAIAATGLLKQELSSVASTKPQSDVFGAADKNSVATFNNMIQAGKEYSAEYKKLNSENKKQFELEKARAEIIKDLKKDNAYLSGAEIDKLAQYKVDSAASRRDNGKAKGFDSDIEKITQRTELLRAETDAQSKLNPLIDDFDYAVAKASASQDLLNQAKENGIAITPELAANIDSLAESYALAVQESNKLAYSQDKIKERAQEMIDLQRDVASEIIKGFRDGKSAAEIFASALNKISDKLIDIGINAAFPSVPNSSGGGVFGGLLSGITKLFGFEQGGYTGDGGKQQPAGVVHKGEFVFDKKTVQAAGGPRALEGLRRSLKGYADGGYVGATTLPSVATPKSSSQDVVNVVLTDDTGRMAAIADQRIKTSSGAIVQVSVQQSVKAVNANMPELISNAQKKTG